MKLIVFTILLTACGTAPKHSAALTDAPPPAKEQGPAGPAGPKGEQGPPGAAGPSGTPGKSAPGCYVQATDEYLGEILSPGCAIIYFPDKVTTAFDNGGNAGWSCFFTSADCSGGCYVGATSSKNTAWYDGAKWWQVTGKEVASDTPVVGSYLAGGQCHQLNNASGKLIALTKEWTPPVPLALPLGTLYVGAGQ